MTQPTTPKSLDEALEGKMLKIHNFDGTSFTGRCRGMSKRDIPLILSSGQVAISHSGYLLMTSEPDDAYPLSRIEKIVEVVS